MREPNASNTAQQNQDQSKPKPVKLDPLGNSTVPDADGPVHGGEAAKPGQMDGDDDPPTPRTPGKPVGTVEGGPTEG